MRSIKEIAAIMVVLLVLPFVVASVQAQPPPGFQRLNPDDFKPVAVVPVPTVFAYPSTTPLAPIYERREVRRPTQSLAPRPQPRPVAVAQPKATPKPTPKATPRPRATVAVVRRTLHGPVKGTATWYCLAGQSVCPWMAHTGNYAAAGPALRRALGAHWRGMTVTVSGNGHSVRIKLIDWCACGGSHVIDLFASAMSQFVGHDRNGRPLRGGFPATIRW